MQRRTNDVPIVKPNKYFFLALYFNVKCLINLLKIVLCMCQPARPPLGRLLSCGNLEVGSSHMAAFIIIAR